MKSKIIAISPILKVKINYCCNNLDQLDIYFPDTVGDEKGEIDYEIYYYDNCETLKSHGGEMVFPFRNSKYLVSKENNISAYAFKQEFTNEHIITRNNNKIIISCKNDYDNKNLIRLIRELMIRKLLEKNYFPIHSASVVNKDGKSLLMVGPRKSGKSTALLYTTAFNDYYPSSNDITFVGEEDNKWISYGIPYDLTFDLSLIDEYIKEYNVTDNQVKYNSSKFRIQPSSYSKLINKPWTYRGIISQIFFTDLSIENDFKLDRLTDFDSIKRFMSQYGKDENFNFGDYLKINCLAPNYRYDDMHDLAFSQMKGNVMKLRK